LVEKRIPLATLTLLITFILEITMDGIFESFGSPRPEPKHKPVPVDYETQYNQLKNAVQDLLCELRIRPQDLDAMVGGYSPDYPGGPGWNTGGSTCKVQLSQIVARKLSPHV